MQKLLTLEEVAERLAVKPIHVRRLISKGQLSAIDIRTGKRSVYRIHPEVLEAFVQGRKCGDHPETARLRQRRRSPTRLQNVTEYFK